MKIHQHITVYQDSFFFAGWPANHGAWQWGNEFLCGFLCGAYDSAASMHHIREPFVKMLARSKDGGMTWSLERPNLDFEAAGKLNPPPAFDLHDPKTIIRVCGVYDTGGDYCRAEGGFYLSRDKGLVWTGPFNFAGLSKVFQGCLNTSRTRVLGNRLFMSVGLANHWGQDKVFVAEHDGTKFHVVEFAPQEEGTRAVMPAVADVSDGAATYMARRRRKHGLCWVDLLADEGDGWASLGPVGETGKNNGNPPALAVVNDKLVVCYGNRTEKRMVAAVSENFGKAWKHYSLREEGRTDIGYPQLFKREDGTLVCVYYWADRNSRQHIEATHFEV